MKRIVPIALTVGLLAPVAARAATFDYRGGCGLTPVVTTGSTGVWVGVPYLYVVPTDTSEYGVPTGAFVTAWCVLWKNGLHYGTVAGPVSGTGAVADAKPITFPVLPGDTFVLCEHVTVDAVTLTVCHDALTSDLSF